jgi:hypothetical protein
LKRVASIGGIWVVNAGWEDVPSPYLDLRACSSRLVSLTTSSLRLSISFWCWASNWAFSSFSICLYRSGVL